MTITVKINDIDRTSYVVWKSLKIENILSKQVDTCNFTIENYETKIYKPNVEDDVKIYRDSDLIFGGNIKRITEKVRTDKILVYEIECADYTRLMDKKRIAALYTNQTVNYIINDLKNRYFPDFTINNVNCPIQISYISFNYEIPSQCLDRLAELTGYDWYVDYNKDIHFFDRGNNPAPFNLDDNNGKYIFDSLTLNRDTSQLRNSIYIRGGEFLGNLYTENLVGDGTSLTYTLAYKYNSITVKVNGTNYTVGVDNVDDPANFDCLYNFQEKVIKFKDTKKPANGATITVSGYPYVPIVLYLSDATSKNLYGEFQYYEYKSDIQDKDTAKNYAATMLDAYKNPVVKGTFQTYESGLRAGQDITIQSDIRGINETVVIDRVTARMITPFDLVYDVSFTSSKESGIIKVLADLLLKKTEPDNSMNDVIYKELTFTDSITLIDSTPNFRDRYTGPWYVSGGSNTPVGYCGFCQAS